MDEHALGTSSLPAVGENVHVAWGDRTSNAVVVYTTPDVVLLEGDLPRGSVPPIGAPLRVSVRGRRSVVAGRLAATGRARRYLVSLGLRPVRRSQRFRVDLPVEISSSQLPAPVRARIVNLSRSGARLRGLDVPVGTDLQLSFTPPGNPGPVDVRAVVVRALSSNGPQELGIALRLGVLWFGPANEARQPARRPTTVFKAASPAGPPPSRPGSSVSEATAPRAPTNDPLPPSPEPATRVSDDAPNVPQKPPERASDIAPGPAAAGALVKVDSAIGGPSVGSLGVTAQVRPGALCTITYVTPGGAVSRARGLVPRAADADGRVSWVWAVSPHTRRGLGQVVVTCDGESATVPVSVE